jgi:hypothetical protein
MSSRDTSDSSSSESFEEVVESTRKREREEGGGEEELDDREDVIEKNGYCWKFFVGRPCVMQKCYYKHEIPDQAGKGRVE